MADLKLGSQIGGNLIWHQGILELNPLDDSLFYKEFDMITSKGGQTINGGINLKGDIVTTGKIIAVGNDVGWGAAPHAALNMDKDNTAGAHWLIASRKADGTPRSGIQVLTNDIGEFRIYTNKNVNYTAFRDGQVFIQATTPSTGANATRKDYVDKEVERAMQFAETTTDKLTTDLATANTRVNTLDAQNVKITGNQTIAGTKTFTDLPIVEDQPTADTHAANKKYVDTKVGTAVQSIATTAPLTTTGGVTPTLAITPTTRTAAGSMSASDKVKLDDLPADALSRSGGNMKNNGFIKIEGVGGIKSLYNGKEYSILRDHNNGNVTLGAAAGDLYVGYNTTSEEYTTKNVLLYAPMKWTNTGRVLVDADGFIPWLSIKDRVGMEGMSMMLKGPIDFDNYNLTGDYNLYLARAVGSNNPPPFDYGTMSVVGSAVVANAFVTQTATDKITGKVYIRTRNDDANKTWSKWKETLNEDSDVAYGYHNKFEVGGDANTFYPVSIKMTGGTSWYSWKRYCFSRAFGAKAPDTWNTATHRGGLTLEFQMSGDSGWGGNSKDVLVNEFSQTYTTVCGGLALTTGSMIVWLRGGGAEYMFHSDEGIKGDVVVNLEKYIAADKKEFLPRTMEEAIAANLAEIMPRWSSRSGEVYDRNRRVMVADGSIPMTGNLKIEGEKASLILKNAPGAAVDKAENYGRIRFEHATGDQHVELWHSVHDDYRVGYGLRVLKPADNKGGAGAWLDVEGDVFAQNFIQTTAQSTNAASCTRKDYVDALVAPKLNKAGDTMTGSLTFSNDSMIQWSRNTDFARIGFKNDSDADADSYMWFETGDNGNEYFKFRVQPTTATTKIDLLDIKSSKADFHIPIVADAVKNAVNVHGRGSISFQDAANTRFHLWADGGAFRLSHGVNAEFPIVTVLSDGTVTSPGTFTAKDFIQSTAQTNNAAASTRKDYVDAQIAAIDAKNVTKAGDTMTGNLTVPKVLLSAAQGTEVNSVVRKDYADAIDAKNVAKAGDTMSGPLVIKVNSGSSQLLRMQNDTDGWTYFQMGHSTTAAKSCHIAWKTITDASAPNVDANAIHFRVGQASTQLGISATSIDANVGFYANNGQIQLRTTSHSTLEFHSPGKHAKLVWMDGNTGDLNIGTSNGAFGEASRVAQFRSNGSGISLWGNHWAAANSHAYLAQHGQAAPFNVDFGTVGGASDYYQIVKGRSVASGAGYTTDVEFGTLRSGATWGTAVIRVGSGEAGTAGSQAAFQFGITGNFVAPGGVYGNAGVYDAGQRCYSPANPVPAGAHNHANIRARDAVVLLDADIGNGNFALSRPWSDFDFVCFCALWDDYGGLSTKTFSRYDLEINQSIGVNYDLSGGAAGLQWMGRFNADNRTFVTSYENCRMRKVYGYNMGTVN